MILDKTSYVSAIEKILNDHTKFSNLDIPTGGEFSYIGNLEDRISSDLNLRRNEKITLKATCKNIKPVRSRPCILYELGKVDKKTKNGLPRLCLILSAIGTLAKFLLSFLAPLTENEYTVTVTHFILLRKVANKTLICIW